MDGLLAPARARWQVECVAGSFTVGAQGRAQMDRALSSLFGVRAPIGRRREVDSRPWRARGGASVARRSLFRREQSRSGRRPASEIHKRRLVG